MTALKAWDSSNRVRLELLQHQQKHQTREISPRMPQSVYQITTTSRAWMLRSQNLTARPSVKVQSGPYAHTRCPSHQSLSSATSGSLLFLWQRLGPSSSSAMNKAEFHQEYYLVRSNHYGCSQIFRFHLSSAQIKQTTEGTTATLQKTDNPAP